MRCDACDYDLCCRCVNIPGADVPTELMSSDEKKQSVKNIK